MHGWDETNTGTSWALRCVQGMSVTAETEQGLRRLQQLRAHSRVLQVCHVIVGCHVLRVDVSLDLGFHVVIGVGRCHWCRTSHPSAGRFHTSTAFHHAYAIPNTKFFSSGCCSPTLSCHRPLNLYPEFLHVSRRENGSFEVLSVHSPSVTVDRRQL